MLQKKKPFQCVQIMRTTDGIKRRSSALRTTCSFIMLLCSLMKIIKRDYCNQKILFISSINNNLKNYPEGSRMAKTSAYNKYFNSSFIKFIPGNQCILFSPLSLFWTMAVFILGWGELHDTSSPFLGLQPNVGNETLTLTVVALFAHPLVPLLR